MNIINKIYRLIFYSKRKVGKWVMIASEFDIEYVEPKAIKGETIIDQLENTSLQSHQQLNIEFLDKYILLLTHHTWVMFFD